MAGKTSGTAIWLLLFPMTAVAQPAAPATEVGLRLELASPVARIQPGLRVPVTIRLLGDPAPDPELVPVLDASTGKFTKPVAEGPGLWHATYRPPNDRHPLAVLLAAHLPGLPPGWTVLRLRSPVELPVNTDKPNVMVTLTVGGRAYGPVRTDQAGRVRVPVEVGPGDTVGQAVAVDEYGNRTVRRVSIPIPPAPRLVGFAEREQLAADSQDSSAVYLLGITADGAPADELQFTARLRGAKGGKVSKARHIGPGLYRLRYTAPPTLAHPQAQLSVVVRGEEKRSVRTFSFDLVAGLPERLGLTSSVSELVADGKSGADLVAEIADRAGNRLAGLQPAITCSPGSVTPAVEVEPGRYRVNFSAPLHRRGEVICRARLARAGRTSLVSEARLRLLAPIPSRIELTSSAERLPLDGRSTARIDIRVFDVAGNPLEGVALKTEAGQGSIDGISEDGAGRYHFNFTAPRGDESTKVRLTVSTGEGAVAIQQTVIVELEAWSAPLPPAPLLTLGPSIGLTSNFGRLLSGGVLLEATARLPQLEWLFLGLEAGYRGGSSNDEVSTGKIRTNLDVVPLHLNLLVRPWPRSIVTALVGLGGGPEFVRWRIRGTDGVWEGNHTSLWGASVLLGAEMRLGVGAVHLTFRYHYAYLNQRAAAADGATLPGSQLKGNVGGLETSLGYRLFF